MNEQEMQQDQVEPSNDVIVETPVVAVEPSGEVIADEPQQKPIDEGFYKNRWAEAQRKLENREKQLEDVLSRVEQKLEQPKQTYSVEELESFQETTDNEAHRVWAKNEIKRLQKEEQAALVRQELQGWQQKQQVENTKQQVFRDVVSRNPDLIQTDGAGNFLGWNDKSPLLNGMQRYLRDPRIANQPDALAIAEKFAIADQYMMSKPKIQNKIVEQKEEIKNLQRKTLMEGGGREGQYTPSPSDMAMADLGKSGSVADAAKVLAMRSK
jgi:hypothetical protein